MKINYICILFFFVCGAATGKEDTNNTQTIFPQQLTAQDLLTYCSSSSLTSLGRQRQRYCWGFISGVEETIRLTLHSPAQPETLKICLPEDASSRNLAKTYILYAASRDSDLSRPAAQIALEALANTYSCSN
ncbi:MAG: Rap1a/Tai family immunity protein [Gammaproteobacteria bacterium]|nr:Rap1a/Tai family immunity protein [Gammaproteobacteria bacterium]